MHQVLLVFLALVSAVCTAAPAEHLIQELPGLQNASGVAFRQYAGYVTIDAAHNKQLFYWFVESQRRPAEDPLVLWLNGGPGSSSLVGLLTEHGPFRPTRAGGLEPYAHAWNRVANVLYVEAPAGVGFSRSDDPSDYTTDDQQTAADNYAFLEAWFALFPEYRQHALYLSGESYAGHYIPTLAREILRRDTAKRLNVAGLLIGDPATHQDWFLRSMPGADAWPYMGFLYHHGLVSQAAYESAFVSCKFAAYMTDCSANFSAKSPACRAALAAAIKEIPATLDVYNVDADVCLTPAFTTTATAAFQHTAQWSGLSRHLAAARAAVPRAAAEPVRYEQDHRVDPCLASYMPAYLNRADVQRALHVEPTVWKEFGGIHYGTMDDDMVPVYRELLNHPRTGAWRILIFSGDFDLCVPFEATQRWVRCLGRPVVRPWHAWTLASGQVGGNIVEYDRIAFLTVKGSGHMVPYYTPDKGFAFFQRWIDNQPF